MIDNDDDNKVLFILSRSLSCSKNSLSWHLHMFVSFVPSRLTHVCNCHWAAKDKQQRRGKYLMCCWLAALTCVGSPHRRNFKFGLYLCLQRMRRSTGKPQRSVLSFSYYSWSRMRCVAAWFADFNWILVSFAYKLIFLFFLMSYNSFVILHLLICSSSLLS